MWMDYNKVLLLTIVLVNVFGSLGCLETCYIGPEGTENDVYYEDTINKCLSHITNELMYIRQLVDINLDERIDMVGGMHVEIDGNGHTMNIGSRSIINIESSNVRIYNATFSGTVSRERVMQVNNGALTFENCGFVVYMSSRKMVAFVELSNGSTLNISNIRMKGSNCYGDMFRAEYSNITGENINTSNIKFVNGGIFRLNNRSYARLNLLNFNNIYLKYGNAINVDLSSVVQLVNSSFSNMDIVDGTLLWARDSTITVNGLYFDSNRIEYDGLYHFERCIVNVSDNVFSGCTVGYSAIINIIRSIGEAKIANVSFANCVSYNYGGAMYIRNSIADVQNITVIGCTSKYGGVGYISLSDVRIDGCSVYKCSVSAWGGAFYIESASRVRINNLDAIEITGATYGGVIYVRRSMLEINDSMIIDSTVYHDGGAIYCEDAWLIMSNSSISMSHSVSGGAIYLDRTNATITECRFSNASATYCGGAIYGSSIVGLYLINTSFDTVSAKYGGAVIQEGGSPLEIRGCNFSRCIAGYSGGALYTDVVQRIENTTFIDCESTWYGGAIYSSVSNCGNDRSMIRGVTFKRCGSNSGGAVYVYYGSSDYIDSWFIGCYSRDAPGGAVYSNTDDRYDNTTFYRCSTKDSGGAIYLDYESSYVRLQITFNNCRIIECSAWKYGGSIYSTYNNDIHMSNTVITGSYSGWNGLAVELGSECWLYMDNTRICARQNKYNRNIINVARYGHTIPEIGEMQREGLCIQTSNYGQI